MYLAMIWIYLRDSTVDHHDNGVREHHIKNVRGKE